MPQIQPPVPAIRSILGCHALIVRGAFAAAVVAIAVGAVDLAQSRAADDSHKIGRAMPAEGNGCGARYRPWSMPEAGLESRRASSPVSLDGKVAAYIGVWKVIAVGTYESGGALRDALNSGCRVGNLAGEIFEQPAFTVSESRKRIALVVLTAADLGLEGKKGTSRAAVYNRAMQLGLRLCPAEVAPQLRLQYPDQPPGEFLHVATNPIATGRAAAAFVVGNGGEGLVLIGSAAGPDRIVPPTTRFVFVRSL